MLPCLYGDRDPLGGHIGRGTGRTPTGTLRGLWVLELLEEGRGREKLFQWRRTGGGTKGEKKAASRLRQRGGRFRGRRICGSSGLLVGQGQGDHGGTGRYWGNATQDPDGHPSGLR